MQPSNNRILGCVREALIREIAPLITSERGTSIMRMVDTALGELLERAQGRAQSLIESQQAQRAAIARAIELLKRDDAPRRRLETVSEIELKAADPASLEQLYAADQASRSALCDLSRQIVALIPLANGNRWSIDARAWVRCVVLEEIERETRTQPASTSPQLASEPPTLANRAPDLLRRCFPSDVATSVESRKIGGGYSRETYSLDAVFATGGHVELIVRKEKANGLLDGIGLTLEGECPFMRIACDSGLPVPRVLWLEQSRELLGESFLVMEKSPGTNIGTGVQFPNSINEKELRGLACLIAELHNVPWEKRSTEILRAARLPEDGEISVQSAFKITLERWIKFSTRTGNSPSPALEASLQWLIDNIPESQARLSLLHGDLGFHNILFRDGTISALLDWELADLGDPARDLALIRRSVERYLPWSTFVGWYREAGGGEVSDAAVSYYELFSVAISLILEATALESKFATAASPEIELLDLGLTALPYFYQKLARVGGLLWQNNVETD